METVFIYLAVWCVVGVVANKHYQHHMAKYGIDVKGQPAATQPHFHKRFDD